MLPEKNRIFSVDFPLDHLQSGIAVGNGYLGLSVWGTDCTLNITVGCSALWDHQGGEVWSPEQNYAKLSQVLQDGDEAELKRIFPWRDLVPSNIPLARVVVNTPSPLAKITLDMLESLLRVVCRDGQEYHILLSPSNKGWFALRGEVTAQNCRVLSGFELAPVLKEKRGFVPPCRQEDCFIQQMPADLDYGLRWSFANGAFNALFFRGEKPAVVPNDWPELLRENREYWSAFWQRVPEVATGDTLADDFYYRGIYAFQSMTAPDGFPAGLQGPWIEDDELPPWSADFHFNINVQMCYWPACPAGLWENLRPLFQMMEGWREIMRRNAKCFVGIDDGYVLPHAVDDRCVCMGGFWPGTVDHTCAGWMAIMMYEYYRYSGDREFMSRFGYDFMLGVMRVYVAMLQKEPDGTYSLPVETSPEFGGMGFSAWGKNPSFHLAAIHRLLRDIFLAAEEIGEVIPEGWREIQKKLPRYAEVDGEIGLWEGLALPESHRHHSHLAGIAPFDCGGIPAEVIKKSAMAWIKQGMGAWAGWSFPWAIMLHNRLGHPEMAWLLLRIWPGIYVNKGGRTLHTPRIPGFSIIWGSDHIMQMDAGMGMVAAIMDMYAYEEQGVMQLFRGFPKDAQGFSCKDLALPGGVKLSGDRDCFIFTAERPTKVHFHCPPGRWRHEGKCYDGDKVYHLDVPPTHPLRWERMIGG